MNCIWPLAFDPWSFSFSPQVAMLIVAALGYLVGRRTRSQQVEQERDHAQRELRRALTVAEEMEKIATGVRESLSRHQTDLRRFRAHVSQLGDNQPQDAWKDLCDQAERILQPTLELSSQMAHAYESLRQQSAHLMSFSDARTDPLTRVHNRRALDESLASQCCLARRYGTYFSLAMFDIDHFKAVNDNEGHLVGDRVLRDLADLLADSVRGGDSVARFGGEEFLVILPQTELLGAGVFAERMRAVIARQMAITVSVGVAQASRGEEPEQVLARVDQALYAAKQAGRDRVYQHSETNGAQAVTPFTLKSEKAIEHLPPSGSALPVVSFPQGLSVTEVLPPSLPA